MTADKATDAPRMADFLLSWDRLGFRLLVFGGLALLWILQGRGLGGAWPDLIWGELVGIMPWAFLAPIVLAMDRRVRIERLGLGRVLAAHCLGMVLVFIPYWFIQRGVNLAWAWYASGWSAPHLTLWLPTRKNVLGSFINVPFVYLLILVGAAAMRNARARREEEVQAERLAGQLSEARLALLQRQIHPHFLFNALQAISTLLHRDPKTADRLLMRLSSLLRAMLDDASRHTMGLVLEMELTRKYLEIEQARFDDRLRVEWSVDVTLLDVQVPSLILLPVVENAIRHGLSPKVGPGRLKVSAASEGPSLVLTVEDDGLGTTLPLRPGVGIGNTRERLHAMYGERGRLEIDTRPNGGFRVRIQIPLEAERS
ncbi:MAG TPA: histidine kinase [Vicinamibacterales bacterium]|jgi:signal transduction histidine kinase